MKNEIEIIDNSNCIFDVKRIEDRLKELGALVEGECEVIEPKQIENKSFDENVKDFMNVGDDLQQAVYHAHDIDVYNFWEQFIEPKQLPENK